MLSHNLADDAGRKVTRQESDVEDDNEEFWNLLGGKEEIMEADDARIINGPRSQDPVMFIVSDNDNELKIESVPVDKASLVTDDVCLIDIGTTVFVWKGNGSSDREKKEAMKMAQTYFRSCSSKSDICCGEPNIITVMEGQEKRVPGWPL